MTYREAIAAKDREDWEEVRAKVLKEVAKRRRKAPRKKEKVVVNDLAYAISRNYRGMCSYGVEALEVVRKGKKVRRYQPRCEVDAKNEEELRAAFGKTGVITDLEEKEAPNGDLVRGWVLRTDIEEEFKWLKDRYVVSLKPMWVWHDAAIPGHVYLCVMGLTLLRYLQWEGRDLDLSVKELVERLGRIRVAVVSKGGQLGSGGRPGWVLEEMGVDETELVSRFRMLDELHRQNRLAA